MQVLGATGADRLLGAIGADERHAARAGRRDAVAVGLLDRTLLVVVLPLQGRGQVEGLQCEPVHVDGGRVVACRVQVEEAVSEVLPGRTLHGGEERLAPDRGEPAPGFRGDVDVPGVRVRVVAARWERRRAPNLESQRDRRVRVGGRRDEVGPDLQVDDETEPPQQRRMVAHHGQLVMKVVLLGELGVHLLPGGGERLRLLGRRPGVEAGEGVQSVGGRAARTERPDQRLHGGVVLGTQLPGLPGRVVQSLAQPAGEVCRVLDPLVQAAEAYRAEVGEVVDEGVRLVGARLRRRTSDRGGVPACHWQLVAGPVGQVGPAVAQVGQHLRHGVADQRPVGQVVERERPDRGGHREQRGPARAGRRHRHGQRRLAYPVRTNDREFQFRQGGGPVGEVREVRQGRGLARLQPRRHEHRGGELTVRGQPGRQQDPLDTLTADHAKACR